MHWAFCQDYSQFIGLLVEKFKNGGGVSKFLPECSQHILGETSVPFYQTLQVRTRYVLRLLLESYIYFMVSLHVNLVKRHMRSQND